MPQRQLMVLALDLLGKIDHFLPVLLPDSSPQ